MASLERFLLVSAAAHGFFAVALGAFGAHGLKSKLAPLADGAARLGYHETAAHYHLAHALAFGLCAYVAQRAPGAFATASGVLLHAGILLFCGSLYAMAITGVRALGAITPIGGLCLLGAWLALALAALRN
jgi:uncharacterized membrane protein YgdD (TMEM256/DUF423 family)